MGWVHGWEGMGLICSISSDLGSQLAFKMDQQTMILQILLLSSSIFKEKDKINDSLLCLQYNKCINLVSSLKKCYFNRV